VYLKEVFPNWKLNRRHISVQKTEASRLVCITERGKSFLKLTEMNNMWWAVVISKSLGAPGRGTKKARCQNRANDL
jgi:hypothetical protein